MRPSEMAIQDFVDTMSLKRQMTRTSTQTYLA